MSYTLRIEAHFDAAHALYRYEGKCNSLHGHTYRIEASVETTCILGESGMAVDFGVLKKQLEPIIDKLDHSVLFNSNDKELQDFLLQMEDERGWNILSFENEPTAETLAKYIFGRYNESLRSLPDQKEKFYLSSIQLWEGLSSSVEYSR